MGRVVLALTLIYAYLNLNEYWIPGYKMATAESHLLHDLFSGSYSSAFWLCQFGTVLLPIIVMCFPKGRTPGSLAVVCTLIAIGAWVKRYLIVVPTLLHPFLPIQDVPSDWSQYFPNWVEWSVVMGALSGMVIIVTLYAKFFPMMSMWEVVHGAQVEESKRLAAEAVAHHEIEVHKSETAKAAL